MPSLTTKNASGRSGRLSLRITAQERALIERAALLYSGGDITRFVVTASIEAARGMVAEHEATTVSTEFREHLYSLLLDPPPPSDALKKLASSPAPDGIKLVKD